MAGSGVFGQGIFFIFLVTSHLRQVRAPDRDMGLPRRVQCRVHPDTVTRYGSISNRFRGFLIQHCEGGGVFGEVGEVLNDIHQFFRE